LCSLCQQRKSGAEACPAAGGFEPGVDGPGAARVAASAAPRWAARSELRHLRGVIFSSDTACGGGGVAVVPGSFALPAGGGSSGYVGSLRGRVFFGLRSKLQGF